MHAHQESHYPVHASAEYWPNDHRSRDQLSIPLTLSFNPLEPAPHLASFSSAQIHPFRCHSCKAFVNYLCVIRSQNEYDCSICGCTNRTPGRLQRDQPEFTVPVYSCISTNPRHRHNAQGRNHPNLVFAFDLIEYGQETTFNFIHYACQTVKELCRQVETAQHAPCNITLLAFDDCIHEYGVNPQGQVVKIVNTHMEGLMSGPQLEIWPSEHMACIDEILDDILQASRPRTRATHTSTAFLKLLENVMGHFREHFGRVFVVSGLCCPPGLFLTGIEEEPEEFRGNYTLNMKKCLPAAVEEGMDRAQLSFNFYLFNKDFVNAMPLYGLSKMTNGELKNYCPTNFIQFFYEFSHAVCEEGAEMGMEAVLKVRNSTGLKLVGVFGQYRSHKGSQDQFELVSCPSSRQYTFEFAIEGKVQQNCLNTQFSTLWTDAKGRRVFKVITHRNKLSGNLSQIIGSVDYAQVNNSYLSAILHNMDLNVKMRNLQITLQERCRKHIKALKKHEGSDSQAITKATPYILFTFFLMRHFIMNTPYAQNFLYDRCIETRSRILTSDLTALHHIWPAVYAVNQHAYAVTEMRHQELSRAEQAVVIDQGTYCYLYVCEPELRRNLFMKSRMVQRKSFLDLVKEEEGLLKASELLEEIREQKMCGYVEVVLMDSLEGACIFDERGALSYSTFLDSVTAE